MFSKEGDTLQIIRKFSWPPTGKLAENLLKQILINVFDRNIIKTKQQGRPLFDYLSVKSDTHIFDTALSNLVHIVHIKGK